MAKLYHECEVFDPIRFTTKTKIPNFILDTWFFHGLISRNLYERLPGIEIQKTSKVEMSSGMYVNQPEIQIGVKINNFKALPITVNVVENGPSDLLLGSDFVELLFQLGKKEEDISLPRIIYEAEEKYSSESVGLRLLSDSKTIESYEVEKFLQSLRKIHNCGVIVSEGMHMHNDWNNIDQKYNTIRKTINENYHLSMESSLRISWTDSGSIWLSLVSGSKKAFSWISQLFEKSMDARLRATMAKATSAEEEAEIAKLTRDEIVKAKKWEQRKTSAENFRKTRKEWQDTILSEIDFKKKLLEEVKDDKVREIVQNELDNAIKELFNSRIYPIVENIPLIEEKERDLLPKKSSVDDNSDDKF